MRSRTTDQELALQKCVKQIGKWDWRLLVNGTTQVQCLRNNTSSKVQEELAGTGRVVDHC